MLDVEELRSRRQASGYRGRRRWALPLVLLAVPLVAFGAWHSVEAVSKLRDAHLYRQAFHEGDRFIQVWFQILLGSMAALSGAAGLLVAGWWSGRTPRRVALVLAVVVAIGVGLAWAATLYVGWHGRRCIGSCG